MNHLWGWLTEFQEACELDLAEEREHAWPMLREELVEVKEALESGDRMAIAHELTDLVYLCYGIGRAYDIRMDVAAKAVHEANMSRLGLSGKAIKDPETGKVLKGPRYRPPRLSQALRPSGRPE